MIPVCHMAYEISKPKSNNNQTAQYIYIKYFLK